MAYQLNRPDLRKSLLVVLRRPDSPYESARFALRDLEPEGFYRVTNLDTKARQRYPGKQLMEQGVPTSIAARPGSVLLLIEREP